MCPGDADLRPDVDSGSVSGQLLCSNMLASSNLLDINKKAHESSQDGFVKSFVLLKRLCLEIQISMYTLQCCQVGPLYQTWV